MNDDLKEKLKELIDSNEPLEFENAWFIIVILLLISRRNNKGEDSNVQ